MEKSAVEKLRTTTEADLCQGGLVLTRRFGVRKSTMVAYIKRAGQTDAAENKNLTSLCSNVIAVTYSTSPIATR